MDNKLLVLGLIIMALQIVAITTVHWSKTDVSVGDDGLEMGLWKACAKNNSPTGAVKKCLDLPPNNDPAFPKDILKYIRALSVAGVVLVFCGLACAIVMNGQHPNCVIACLALGGLLSISASILWGARMLNIKDQSDTHETLKTTPCISWYLNLAGGVLAVGMAGYLHWH